MNKPENLVDGSIMADIGRGYNALATNGDYSKAVLKLSDAEKMSLNTIA
jgi:hypothetical protein